MKGNNGIDVMMQDCFAKRPGLYVMQGNTAVKVGNFASENKAKLFQTYLEYMCGLGPEPDSLEKEE